VLCFASGVPASSWITALSGLWEVILGKDAFRQPVKLEKVHPLAMVEHQGSSRGSERRGMPDRKGKGRAVQDAISEEESEEEEKVWKEALEEDWMRQEALRRNLATSSATTTPRKNKGKGRASAEEVGVKEGEAGPSKLQRRGGRVVQWFHRFVRRREREEGMSSVAEDGKEEEGLENAPQEPFADLDEDVRAVLLSD
jgi:hypothetical protein